MAAINIRLTYHEVNHAQVVGLARHWTAWRDGRAETNGSERANHWFTHQIGAIAELAVAKYLKVHWDGNVGVTGQPDITYNGLSIEVRAVEKIGHRLIVHPEDEADFFCLVIVQELPRPVIGGVIASREARQDRFWADPQGNRPAYFVPQSELFTISKLKHYGRVAAG